MSRVDQGVCRNNIVNACFGPLLRRRVLDVSGTEKSISISLLTKWGELIPCLMVKGGRRGMMMAYSGICAFLLGTELRRFACPDWQPFSRNHVYSRVT